MLLEIVVWNKKTKDDELNNLLENCSEEIQLKDWIGKNISHILFFKMKKISY